MIRKMLLLSVFGLLAFGQADAASKAEEIYVRDFGARPDDGKDDLIQVQRAISKLARTGARRLVFDEGTYDFDMSGAMNEPALLFENLEGLQVLGSTDAQGNPATRLVRHYEMARNLLGANFLRFVKCDNLLLKNVIIDNGPRYMTSGEVIYNDGNVVIVKIFPGCSYVDGTVMYCCNLWDLRTRNLKHVGSVTFGGSITKQAAAYTTHYAGDPAERKVFVSNPSVAAVAEVGDGISWHFGWEGLQVDFRECDNMTMENVHSYSAIGFHFQSSLCKNIHGKKVRICREGDDLNAGSRDAWKIWLCKGEIVMEDIYIDGVRWDGQNVHGKYIFPIENDGAHCVTFSYNGMRHERFDPGEKVGMWKDRDTEVLMTIKSYVHLDPTEQYKKRVRIEFEEDLPDFIGPKTVCNTYSHSVKYVLKDSEFRNIAGNASVLRTTDAQIDNCSFHHLMYPAIGIGAELGNESVTGRDIVVENCLFEDCCWQNRGTQRGAVGIGNQPVKDKVNPYISNITVRNNRFVDCRKAVSANGVCGLHLYGNTYENVEEKLDTVECKNVQMED